ncbi:MAG: hemolysin III family protein [Planctomycetaceae bacterium]|nr:hemolysin III family protein [Planctomycetaceae bacterium]
MATVTSACNAELQPGATPDILDVDLLREEWANAFTHGIGLLLSLIGGWYLNERAAASGDAYRWAGCAVYALTLIGVYTFSTLSHLFQRPTARHIFRVFDQAFIYLLIVGTYTPIAAGYLHGGWLTFLLVAMWGVAIAGFLSKTVLRHRIDSISTVGYLVLGWMPALAVPAAFELLPYEALWMMVGGGLLYTLGVVFLVLDRKVPYFHAVWHLMVMAAGATHFYAIYLFVAVPTA